MKKNILFCIALLLCCVQAGAQKTLNIYQEGLVIKRIPAAQVDSISLTDREPYTINMWSGGRIFQTYASEEVDSIKVIDEKGGPLSYLGIVGFNSELYKKDVSLLAKSTISQHESFIDKLSAKDGTTLYYAVDNALDLLEKSNITTPLSNINLVTFTDGLDQGSIMMNHNYASSNAYLQAISNRIKNSKFKGLKVDAYTIGLRGTDVSDVYMFQQNLNSLASSDPNAFELTNMNQLDTRLQEIANKIISVNKRQTISVRIPGVENGTRVRFTFDGKDAEKSQLYIDGTFNFSDYSLRDITYYGIKARSGSFVQGTQDGIFITYTFRGLRKEYGDEVLPTNNVMQYYRLPSQYSWQKNSEFQPTSNTQCIVSHSGTAIILVLDCSSSLGNTGFKNMKSYAKKFIRLVANNALPFTFGNPSNLQAAMDNNAFAINLSWDAVKGADYYQVYRSSSSSSGYTMVADNVTSCTWKDTSLQGSSFYYKVCAVGLGMTSGMSNATSQIKCSLAAPQNVKGELTKSNNKLAINVKWDPVKYAEYYQVYRASSDYSSYYYTLIADNVTSTSYLDLSPLSGNNYYKIRAVGHGMTSSDSYSRLISNLMSAPTNVAGELVLDGGNMVINVTWDAVAVAEKYQVYRSSSKNGTFNMVADNVTSNSWKDTAPLTGYNYYKVVAVGYELTSQQSKVSNATNCALNAPTNVVATLNDTEFAVTVSWNAVEHATHYKVYRSKDGYSSTYELVADNITSCSWKDVSPNGSYNYYKVYAACNGFTGSASNSVYVYSSLSTPQNVTGELTVSNSKLAVNIKWDPVKYAEYYQVYRSNSSSYYSSYTLIADNVTSASYLDLSPSSGNNYYKIRAVGHGMTSSDSYASGSFNTSSISAPSNVKGALALDGNNLVINVTWDAVAVAEKYQVYRSSSNYYDFVLLADNVTSNSWKDTAPLVGSNYYKVVAIGYGLTSQQSNVSNWANCALDAPQNVGGQLVINGDKLAVNVTWDAVLYAESYTIYRSSSYYGSFTEMAKDVKVNSWKDESPSEGANYYKVKATGHGLTSESYTSNAITGNINAPVNVRGERAVNGNKFAVNVTWDAVEFAQSYTIYRSDNTYGTYSIVADNVSTNSWKDETPLEGYNYYKVVAVGYGMISTQSSYSDAVNVTINTPQNLRSEMVLSNNKQVVRLSWDAVEFANSYNVYRSNSYYGEYTKIADGVTSTTWNDESPLEGYNYYKVVASGYGLTSSMSSYISIYK